MFFPTLRILSAITAALLCVASPAVLAQEQIDSFADAAEVVPSSPSETLVLDSFAAGAEYIPFAAAEVPFDAWAQPGERSLLLSLAPVGDGGSFDQLGVPGDELESYAPHSPFRGGYGQGEKRCVVLMYHRFRVVPKNAYEVSHYDFEEQMEYIAQNGYEVISIDQLTEALQTNNADLLPPRSVVITIDDGYRCAYDYAWHVFSQYGFPFAFYIYTNYVDCGGNSLSWNELREIAADPLCTIGAHSKSHSNLANPKKARGPYEPWLWSELTYPKHLLEAEVGKPVRTFAWPYGSFNLHTRDTAIRAGFESLLTIVPGSNDVNTSPYNIHRYGVYWRTSLATFALMLEGKPVTDEMVYRPDATEQPNEFLIP